MKLQRSQKTSVFCRKLGKTIPCYKQQQSEKTKKISNIVLFIKPDNCSLGHASCLSERMDDSQKGKWAGRDLIISDDDQLYGPRRYWTTSIKDNAKELTQYLLKVTETWHSVTMWERPNPQANFELHTHHCNRQLWHLKRWNGGIEVPWETSGTLEVSADGTRWCFVSGRSRGQRS